MRQLPSQSPLVAFLTLKLCEEKLLDLDTPLTDYLSEPYLENQPLLAKITARNVLTHSTGFPNWRPKGLALEIFFTPGDRFSSSGEGYMYLQHVLENITGKNLEELFQEWIFNSLKMKGVSLLWHQDFEDSVAQGYLRDGVRSKSGNQLNLVLQAHFIFLQLTMEN